MDDKHESNVVVTSIEGGLDNDSTVQKGGTTEDVLDMDRLGKVQQLRRNFNFISIAGFIMILQTSWESTLVVAQYGLINGGTAGMIWLTVFVIAGIMCMICSMAEMASMAPTAGGQYHWVSEFAPPSVQKTLSYIVGWCCCLGWVTGNPAAAQITSQMIQGLIILKNEEADVAQLWQTSLFIMAILLIAAAVNIFLPRYLPQIEQAILVLHVAGFFAFLILFWAMSDHASAVDVFTKFEDNGGWGNLGLSTLVGITAPLWCFLSPDAGPHMSEEVKDASRVLPSVMVWATAANAVLGMIMMITFCFCIGDVESVLESPTGVPVIQILYNITGSFAGTAVLTITLIVLYLVGTISCMTATSRQVWAFARDNGFPFSATIRLVHRDIPLTSLIAVLAFSLALTCINFGSDVALGAILSVSNAALLFSYICSIGCIRLKRLRGEKLLPRRWSLGKWGGMVNDAALVFLVVSFVMSFFPMSPLPTAADMNWGILIFGVVMVFSAVWYVVRGRAQYVPPVTLVKSA